MVSSFRSNFFCEEYLNGPANVVFLNVLSAGSATGSIPRVFARRVPCVFASRRATCTRTSTFTATRPRSAGGNAGRRGDLSHRRLALDSSKNKKKKREKENVRKNT